MRRSNQVLKLAPAVAIAAIAATVPAHANRVDFTLSARVAPACSIAGISPVAGNSRQVQIMANCNAEHFSIELGGGLNDATISAVNSDSASPQAFTSGFSARASRPGSHRFTVTFDQDVSLDMPVSAQIALY